MADVGKPYIVGLTGGIASGKTSASDYLGELGAKVIDADEISRALTSGEGEALPMIRERFGDGVFLPDGQLDRRALGTVVFGSEPQRRALEAILHPMIQRKMLKQIETAGEAGEKLVVLSVPLLFETGMDVLCDEVWVMALERETQIRRIMIRDNLDEEAARQRIDSQMPLEEKLKRANVVVKTGRPVEQTRQELGGLYKDLKKRINRSE